MTQKLCPKCNQNKELDEFHNSKRSKDGKHLWCRECCNANSRRNRALHKAAPKVEPVTKFCSRCEQTKEAHLFGHDAYQKDGLACYCKECVRIKDQQYRIANPDKCRERRRNYYRANADAIGAKAKRWQEQNPESFAYYCRKSSAKQRGIPWELDKEWYVAHIWNHQCAYGPHPANGGIDRLDSNGIYEPANCVPCCWWCNSIKNEHSVEEMYQHIAEMLKHRIMPVRS